MWPTLARSAIQALESGNHVIDRPCCPLSMLCNERLVEEIFHQISEAFGNQQGGAVPQCSRLQNLADFKNAAAISFGRSVLRPPLRIKCQRICAERQQLIFHENVKSLPSEPRHFSQRPSHQPAATIMYERRSDETVSVENQNVRRRLRGLLPPRHQPAPRIIGGANLCSCGS